MSAHGCGFVVGPWDRRNQGIIHVVSKGLSRIVVSGEKPRVRDVKRDLVHKLVLVRFNKGWPLCLGKVVCSSLANCPSGIYASIVEGCARQLVEFRLWLCRHGLKILFIFFQLHSWELGAYVRVHRCILILVQQSLKFGIILRNLVGPFVWLVPTIQEAKLAPLFLSCSNRIDLPDYSSRHRHGRE
jgi:hypothetical protein